MIYEIILPKLGQTVEEGRIVDWMKEEGDAVDRGEVLFTVETDKAVLDVEATKRGFLRKILVPAGELRPVLTVVGLMTRSADEPLDEIPQPERSEGPPASSVEDTTPAPTAPLAPAAPARAEGRLFASPRARKFAREHGGVDLSMVTGTGPNGRIVERDVAAYLETQPKATPVAERLAQHLGVDLRTITGTGPGGRITKEDVEGIAAKAEAVPEPLPAPAPEPMPAAQPAPAVEEGAVLAEVPMSGVRAIIAQRMHESHQTTAPVTLTTEVDATALVALRERLKASLADELGFNVGYNDLLVKLSARALSKFPNVNARLVGDTIHHLRDVNVGLAIDTERGLLVPVVRDADRKGVAEIARDIRDLVVRTRAGRALPDELSGGTFTVTNLGMYEIDAFTPIINFPETAILGVGRIKDRPAVVDGALCVRKTMWLSLTFDHRLVDGAPAARFLQHIKQLVEEPYLLLA